MNNIFKAYFDGKYRQKQAIQVTVQHQLEHKTASSPLIRHFIICYKITLILKSCNIHI